MDNKKYRGYNVYFSGHALVVVEDGKDPEEEYLNNMAGQFDYIQTLGAEEIE